ncbi:50S ribosomal protein L11 methyltransferase [Francisellaceae bacterium]|nr:50S ribosomal protein L11 methyltransferase [Francisellaceae bacterium]
MLWKEITIPATNSELENIENTLLNLGACSVTLKDAEDQPILEPAVGDTPVWDKLLITALFTEDFNLNKIEKAIIKSFPNIDHKSISNREFPDQDWERSWMDDFHPMKFGSRLWICPSWKNPPQADAINIILDPGLAFGTGTHPTTSLCLEWLDQNINTPDLVVDYGCGSGVLAIAALKLGAKKAIGIDNDPQAIIASKDNNHKNGIPEDLFKLYLPDDQPEHIQSDVLIANILAMPLISLIDTICSKLKPNGKIALSGILAEQADDVAQAYSKYCHIENIKQLEDWVIITGIKK